MMKNKQDDFAIFQRKIAIRFFSSALLSVAIVIALYFFIWKERFGDWIVSILELVGKMEHEEAFLIYHYNFRGYKEIFFVVAIVAIFLILLLLLFRWLTKYFREINLGIDNLLAEDEKKIRLSPEMLPFEYKLNTVKQKLKEQKEATALAEQRKDELMMYLAHDIRTPLTSVIGYLSLLEEESNKADQEQAKNIHIALDKAYRLDKMVNEFFEITRYHSKQIKLKKQSVDLYYMLIQLRDEFLPSFSLRNNTVSLDFDENTTIYVDDKIVTLSKAGKVFLDKGVHNLSVTSPSYRNEVRTLRIDRAKTTELQVELKSIEPSLFVSAPEGTKTFLDDKAFTAFGKETYIEEGEHKIRFTVGDYEIVRTINAIKGKTYKVNCSVDLTITEE